MTAKAVLYTDADGRQHRARVVWGATEDRPAKLIFRRGARLELVDASYSPTREPGTWSRIVEPA